MKYIETDFSKDLCGVLRKHKKSLISNKEGIFVIDDDSLNKYILLTEAETATEVTTPKIIFIKEM